MSKQNGNKGRRFDRAFKEEAVRLLQTSGRRQRQIAGDLGISVSALGRWVTELRAEDLLSGPHEDAAKEITRRRREAPETLEPQDPRLELAARELSKLKPDDLEHLLKLLAALRSDSTATGGDR